MKKKLVSLGLTLALCLGLTVPAMAAGTTVELPEEVDLPGVTAYLSNVQAVYTVSLPFQEYDEAQDTYVEVRQDVTVYQLPTTGSVLVASIDSKEDWLFPGDAGLWDLTDGVYTTNTQYEWGGQAGTLIGPGTATMSMEREDRIYTAEIAEDAIFGMQVDFEGLTFYYTYADISAYAVKTEAPVAAAGQFSDVPVDQYYAGSVAWAVEKGITNGTSETTFSPGATCTNAHILTFMWRAAGSPEPAGANPFTNLSGSEYYYKAALWAQENGIVTGSVFEAEKPCTRAMTMEYFWKQAGSPQESGYLQFDDVSPDAPYAQAVEWAVNNWITNGTSETTFSPDTICTRGHIVTFLHRALA